MGLEVYYKQDIQRALDAANHSMDMVGGNGNVPSLFAGGWRAALDTIALSFGLDADYSKRHLAMSLRFLQEIEQPVLEHENRRP